MTTVASGRWTSAPVEVAKAIGTNPRLATRAVINTGRKRRMAPAITASRIFVLWARNWLMELTRTTPLSTATPNSAMNPMDADKLKFIWRTQSAATPPTSAKGTFNNTRKDWVTEANVV